MSIYSKLVFVKYLIIAWLIILIPYVAKAQNNEEISYYQALVIDQYQNQTYSSLSGTTKFNDWQEVKIRFVDGPLKNQEAFFKNQYSVIEKNDRFLQKNDRIIVSYQVVNNETKISLVEYNRTWSLILLMIVCLLLIFWIGRWIGLRAIFSFAWIGTILVFLLRSILSGYDVYGSVIVASILIVLGSSAIVLGINRKTLIVVLASIGGICISALILFLAGYWAHFSAIGHEETSLFMISPKLSKLNLLSLIYGGIIIGAIGSMMDMSISMVSGLEEILFTARQKRVRKISQSDIFSSGLNLGRNMMAAETNTMALAYFGSAILLWIIALSQNYSWKLLLNFSIVFGEILRILAGAIGIFSVIPLTAWIASKFLYYKYTINNYDHE